ncbi:DMT family transporter [Termitidicoccus mucosus]|uniref:EamA family transporter n=1 Tax=Termitidicoccus mucosus TaxID=1184151 RepID=UPI00083909EC
MTPAALGLLLVAAMLHATWNYWAKRAGGGLPFVFLTGLVICAAYVPAVAVYWFLKRPGLPWAGAAGVMFVSGALKTGYSLYLQRGYRAGDFSLIYPLARGTGPLLSTLAAVALLGERPPPAALAGGLVIIAGIFWLTGGTRWLGRGRAAAGASAGGEEAARMRGLAARYGVMSGVFIASYTLWDRHAVAGWLLPPLLYDAGTSFTQVALLTPFAWRRRAEVAREWREHRLNAFCVGLFSPASYVLVLTAMTFTPVSYVAPAREVSIIIGAFFGAKLLNEADARRRIVAAAVMAAGIALLVGGSR